MYIEENIKKEMKSKLKEIEKIERKIRKAEGKKLDDLLEEKHRLEKEYEDTKRKMVKEYNDTVDEIRKQFDKKIEVLKGKYNSEDKKDELNEKIKSIKEKLNEKTDVAKKELAQIGIAVENIFPEEITEKTKQQEKNGVLIEYYAKSNLYMATNVANRDIVFKERNEQNEEWEKTGLVSKIKGKLNVDIASLLLKYDRKLGQKELSKYVKTVVNNHLDKEEMKEKLKEENIKIVYNLDGLYDTRLKGYDEKEEIYTPEEREQIFKEASEAKKAGIAKVKMNIKTRALRLKEKVFNKVHSKVALPQGKTLRLQEPAIEDNKKLDEDEIQYQQIREEIDKMYQQKKEELSRKYLEEKEKENTQVEQEDSGLEIKDNLVNDQENMEEVIKYVEEDKFCQNFINNSCTDKETAREMMIGLKRAQLENEKAEKKEENAEIEK